MGTKVKGVLKGLRFISQIFEDEKKKREIEIGFPTDVKHVAHIGWDGPSQSIDNAPSWMKEYKVSETVIEEGKENPSLRCRSQEFSSQRATSPQNNPPRDMPDLPKPSRRNTLDEGSPKSSPKGGSKSRKSRRNSTKSNQKQKDSGPSPGSESPSRTLMGLPKKSSRKKTKESLKDGSSRSRKKDVSPSNSCSSSFSDHGLGNEPTTTYDSIKLVHSTSLRPSVTQEEKSRIL